MATVSDQIPAAATAAATGGGDSGGGPRGADVSTPTRTRARARVAVTERDDNPPTRTGLPATMRDDWQTAWWRTATPLTPAGARERRVPSPDDVPDGSALLRYAWATWNTVVAVPATYVLTPVARVARPPLLRQLLYGLVWVLQHPARSFLAALITGPVVAMWIAF